jgi:Zn finger protein HypA/HybF involved in hydrogenase expression
MSRAKYMANYRERKQSDNYVDLRKKDWNKLIDHCLNCNTLLGKRHRANLIETRGYKCEECEISDWRNKKISLELDHINGNFNDNSLKNVRLLCPNCHSQTPTFKSKNTGKGRLLNSYEPKPFYSRLSNLGHQ